MHKFQKALLITALASNLSMTKAQLFSDVLYSIELLLNRKMDITLECCHTVNNDTLLLQLCISSKYLRTYSKWYVTSCKYDIIIGLQMKKYLFDIYYRIISTLSSVTADTCSSNE